jgi:hypothetical protein
VRSSADDLSRVAENLKAAVARFHVGTPLLETSLAKATG